MAAGDQTPASFKDLCIDAVDPLRLGRFWADVLGLELQQREDGLVRLTGLDPQTAVWINPVPEPVSVKQRVHLDVHAAAVSDVLDRGATPLDLESFDWVVLRDPEGGELCVFERDVLPERRLYGIVVDSADPEGIARWWAEVIGGRWSADEEHGWAGLEDIPGAPFDYLVFVPVPEPKAVKNRVHWDVDVGDLAGVAGAAGVDRLIERGATLLRSPDDAISWTVLADPEGNEFCAFTP